MQAWACRHLTSLAIEDGTVVLLNSRLQRQQLAAGLGTSLQSLHLRHCEFEHNGAGFPAALCMLHQLTSLLLFHCSLPEDEALPRQLSLLRWAEAQVLLRPV